jgi:hypothetical protein
MALPTSGPISMSQIKAFFNSTSYSLRAYAAAAKTDTGLAKFDAPDKLSEFLGLDTYGGVVIDPGGGGGGGGGGGCLAYGTKVLMYDGSYKNVEDLIIGDIVKSIVIGGLQSSKESAWENFTTNDFQYEESLSIIYDIQDSSFNQYYLINNELKVTFEHPIFVKRNNEYFFTKTENLLIGDYVFKSNNEFEIITSIDIIDDVIQTININIEENDVYFGGDILVHNLAIKPE